MQIQPNFRQNTNSLSFKKWVDREYTKKIEYDRYPDNPDYHYTDYEVVTYTKTVWIPEYDDYFSKDTVKEDAEKYSNKPNTKDFLKAAARSRIIDGNKAAHAKAPKFGFFSNYRYLVNKYVKDVQEYMNSGNKS